MNERTPTASQIADDLIKTRRQDQESRISALSAGEFSSVRQYIKSRLTTLLNRARVLDVQNRVKGRSPENYDKDSGDITDEIRLLDKIAPYFNIED